MTNELTFEQAEWALIGVADELRKAQVVETVWLEYPVYLSVNFVADDPNSVFDFTVGFAQYDENENPIGERLVVQALTKDGVFVNSAEFDFVPNGHAKNAENILECILGSNFFTETENN